MQFLSETSSYHSMRLCIKFQIHFDLEGIHSSKLAGWVGLVDVGFVLSHGSRGGLIPCMSDYVGASARAKS